MLSVGISEEIFRLIDTSQKKFKKDWVLKVKMFTVSIFFAGYRIFWGWKYVFSCCVLVLRAKI